MFSYEWTHVVSDQEIWGLGFELEKKMFCEFQNENCV